MTLAVNIAQSGSNNVTFRNKLINGACVIDQRNAGASVTPTNGQYTLDRWALNASISGKFTVQQNAGSVTPPAGFSNYVGLTSTSAYTVGSSESYAIYQLIEGYNIADLNFGSSNAKTVTLSFWVRSSLTGLFGGVLGNSGYLRTYPFTYTISSANTWQQISITIAGDSSGTWSTTNGTGISAYFSIGTGSAYQGTANVWTSTTYLAPTGQTSVVGTNGATFYITGVQLEAGTTASPFEYRQYGTELALCQRYYFRAVTGDSQVITNGFYFTSTDVRGVINFPCTMRTSPSLVSSSGTNYFRLQTVGGDDTFNTLLDAGPNTTTAMYLYINANISGTAGNAGAIISNNASASLAFSAEL